MDDAGPKHSLKPYPDPDRPGCWRVPVASRVHKMEAVIDAGSLPLVEGRRWNWSPGRGNGHNGTVVLLIKGSPKKTPLRQIIMGVEGRAHRVTNLNGDPLDCRRENLIVRTPAELRMAMRKPASFMGQAPSSRFKGVRWTDEGRKWVADITIGGRRRTLGRFRSEVDAALAYDSAAREVYGEHALLNIEDAAAAERLRRAEAPTEAEPFPPPGFVDMDDACQMFGIPPKAWVIWEGRGRIRCAGWFARPGSAASRGGRCKLYPLAELERLREEFARLGDPYPDPESPGCYRVPVSSYVSYREAIIDAESLPLVQGRKWVWVPLRNVCGGEVVLVSATGHGATLTRIVAGISGFEVRAHHANGDPLDCRRANLLVRTLQQQVQGNRKMARRAGRPCTSRFKGVHWCEPRAKWVAQIRKEGLHRYLGGYGDEMAAAEAYDEAARELFGEHAFLNFPSGVEAQLEAQQHERIAGDIPEAPSAQAA